MSRDITAALSTAYNASTIKPITLLEAEFKSETTRIWTGYGDLSWDNKTWSGTGTYISVSAVEETYEISPTGVEVSLSGVATDMLSLALDDEYHARDFTLYLGALNEDNTVVANPTIIFRGKMDTMAIQENGENSSITLTVENRLIDLERPRVTRYTSEDQKARYPGDKGFEFVTSLQDQKVKWGRE